MVRFMGKYQDLGQLLDSAAKCQNWQPFHNSAMMIPDEEIIPKLYLRVRSTVALILMSNLLKTTYIVLVVAVMVVVMMVMKVMVVVLLPTEYNTHPNSWYDLYLDQCWLRLYDLDVWPN